MDPSLVAPWLMGPSLVAPPLVAPPLVAPALVAPPVMGEWSLRERVDVTSPLKATRASRSRRSSLHAR